MYIKIDEQRLGSPPPQPASYARRKLVAAKKDGKSLKELHDVILTDSCNLVILKPSRNDAPVKVEVSLQLAAHRRV